MKIKELTESPQRRQHAAWPSIKDIIEQDSNLNKQNIHVITNNISKYDSGGLNVYYWYHVNGKIILAVRLEREHGYLTIRQTGRDKNSEYTSPYASDFYETIHSDAGLNIHMHSDQLLSDDGFNIWKRLYDKGLNIMVKDNRVRNSPYINCPTYEDFAGYFGDDQQYKNYSYVLC